MIPFLVLFLSFFQIQAEILMVAEFFRHGARDPVYDFYDAKSFPSKGELTSVGMRQHYILGQILRFEYIEKIKFLSPKFKPSEIYVSSTNKNRTITSALTQIYGMYPLGTGPALTNLSNDSLYYPPFESEFKPEIDNKSEALPAFFQPIPIHSTSHQEQILRPYSRECKLNAIWQTQRQNDSFFLEIEKELEPTREILKRELNLTGVGLMEIKSIYDVFQNDRWSGRPLPSFTSSSLLRNMSFVYDFWYYFVSFGYERQRLTLTGPLFQELRHFFRLKIKGLEPKKWLMYSAHDTTLIMLLAALNLSNWQCHFDKWRSYSTELEICYPLPDYASNLIFELHHESNDSGLNNEFYVKIRYNGNYIKQYDYQNFEEILNKSINYWENDQEFQNLCGNNQYKLNEKKNQPQIFIRESEGGQWLVWGLLFGISLSGVFLWIRSRIIEKKYQSLEEIHEPKTLDSSEVDI